MIKSLLLTIPALLVTVPVAAQTCSNSIDPTAPITRYTLHDDGTVTDDATGLRWQRCPAGFTLDDGGTPLDYTDDGCDTSGIGTLDWQGALQAAESANTGSGVNSWRLPNIKELMSLVERQCAAPAVNANVFPDMPQSALLWSSTTYIHNDTATVLNMADGTNSTAPKEGFTGSENYVMLVR